MIRAFLTGIHPRSERLVNATRRFEKGLVTNAEQQRILEDDIRQLVSLQERAGFTHIADGLLDWQDLFRPIVSRIEGVIEGPLTRWFSNNTFYRKPIIIGEMMWRREERQNLIHHSLFPRRRQWKAILPGPYTFAMLSDTRHHKHKSELLNDYADLLKEEVRRLSDIGVNQIQLNEPSIAAQTPDEDWIEKTKEAIMTIRRGASVEVMIHTYFASIKDVLPDLLEFDVDIVGVDLYETEIESISDIDFTKTIACGCVNSRNSIIEDEYHVRDLVREVVESLHPPDVCICPNCDLEFLPRIKADEKVMALGRAMRLLKEEM